MPIGLNQVVPRFVRGHVYRVYPPKAPDKYTLLRFKGRHALNRKWYVFIHCADNYTKISDFPKVLTADTIRQYIIEEVRLIDMPRYISAKSIGKEFEKVLKGEPIYRRKLSKLRKT
jgi:hypothetical protein